MIAKSVVGSNGEIPTDYYDSVGSERTTYYYPKASEGISVTNRGTADIILMVDRTSYTITPNQTQNVLNTLTSFSLVATFGTQAFTARAVALQGGLLNPPSGLGYMPPFNAYRDRSGIYTDFDITKYRPAGKTYYVAPGGLDSNDGLTLTTAFLTMSKALSMPDVALILVRFGLYDRTKGLSGLTISKSVGIVAYGGPVTFSGHDNLTWTVAGGYTNTYQATRSNADAVWDAKAPDASGDYAKLTKQSSIANVDANPGSWYTDGTTVYVRTSDSRAPDANIRVYLLTGNGTASGGISLYLEGITFEGGTVAMQLSNTSPTAIPTGYFKNCGFKYSSAYQGLAVLGGITYAVNCTAARNNQDGFNYHSNNGVNCRSIEINCTGRNNGYTGADNNNGSTTHDGNIAVRINGTYNGNQGPNVVDVAQAKSWNVGCNAYGSTATTDVQNCNYQIEGQMWLESCVSSGSPYDLALLTSGSVMNIKDMNGVSKLYTAPGTSIAPY